MGFVCHEGAYLHSPWNVLDFTIVLISILVRLADAVPELRPLRVLRVARILRPLRLVARNAGMKLIITSLFKAMPAVSNVFGVILAIQLVFAILGMQLFMGTLASCSDPTILTKAECLDDSNASGSVDGPQVLGATTWDENRFALEGGGHRRVWSDPEMGSFDDFGAAMRLLYVMSSGDQWEVPSQLLLPSLPRPSWLLPSLPLPSRLLPSLPLPSRLLLSLLPALPALPPYAHLLLAPSPPRCPCSRSWGRWVAAMRQHVTTSLQTPSSRSCGCLSATSLRSTSSSALSSTSSRSSSRSSNAQR